jgi:Protein of unknown function (DUF1579)
MARTPSTEHERLAALVGRWRTSGRTKEEAGAEMRIEAVDTYQWLPGRFALLHTVDARVGEERVGGAEIIGWDPARGSYVTQYFGSDGPNSYEASLTEKEGSLVWSMRSRADRFHGHVQPRRQHHHGPVGAARRRSEVAAVDADHAHKSVSGRSPWLFQLLERPAVVAARDRTAQRRRSAGARWAALGVTGSAAEQLPGHEQRDTDRALRS